MRCAGLARRCRRRSGPAGRTRRRRAPCRRPYARSPAAPRAATDGGVGAGAPPSRRRALARLRGARKREVAADVVEPHDERPQRGVADDADRAGSTTSRWNWSRCMPERVGEDRLDDVAVRDDGVHARPSSEPRAFQSRTASTARACMARIDSPPSPGNVIADGCDWTTFHSGSLASFVSSCARPVAVAHLARSGRRRARGTSSRPSSSGRSVSWQRCSGLVTTAASGTPASRPASAATCAAAGVVEGDARGPAGEHAGAVGGGPAVPDEQHRGHVAALYERADGVRHNGRGDRRLRPLPRRRARGVARRLLRRARRGARARGQLHLDRAARADAEASWRRSPSEFGLHPLAVEDALKAHQRPKVEEYDDSLFVVLKTVRYDEATPADRARRRDALRRRLVRRDRPARRGPGARGRAPAAGARAARCSTAARRRCCTRSPTRSSTTTATIALAVEEDIEEVEEQVFSPERSNDAARIYNLKREVIEFRRARAALWSSRWPGWPTGRSSRTSHEQLQPFFRDVADHATAGVRAGRRASTTCSPRCSTPISRRWACSRTRTCGGSRRGWRSWRCPR